MASVPRCSVHDHKPLTLLQLQKQLRRVWDMMAAVLNTATVVQFEGKKYCRTKMLHDLFITVDLLCVEDKNRLAVHEREMVIFARKFAYFMRALHGSRLRLPKASELQALKRMAQPPTIGPDGQANSEEEEKGAAASEEAAAAVAAIGDDAMQPPLLSAEQGEREEPTALPPSLSLRTERGHFDDLLDDVVPLEKGKTTGGGGEGEEQGTKRRSSLDQVGPEPAKRLALSPRLSSVISSNSQGGGAAAPLSDLPVLQPSARPRGKVYVVGGRVYLERKPARGALPIVAGSSSAVSSAPSSSSVLHRRGMVRCTKCAQLVAGTDLPMHYRIFHAQNNYLTPPVLERPSTKLLQQQQMLHLQPLPQQRPLVDFPPESLVPSRRCPDLACDFVCDTEIERLVHQQSIHCDPFKEWKLSGRLNLHPDTVCPFCPHPVINVCALREHLFRMHPTRMFSQKELYSCTTCNARFGRLYQVYAHWHLSPCTDRMRVATVNPAPRFVPTLGGATMQPLAKTPIILKAPIAKQPKT